MEPLCPRARKGGLEAPRLCGAQLVKGEPQRPLVLGRDARGPVVAGAQPQPPAIERQPNHAAPQLLAKAVARVEDWPFRSTAKVGSAARSSSEWTRWFSQSRCRCLVTISGPLFTSRSHGLPSTSNIRSMPKRSKHVPGTRRSNRAPTCVCAENPTLAAISSAAPCSGGWEGGLGRVGLGARKGPRWPPLPARRQIHSSRGRKSASSCGSTGCQAVRA